MMVRHRLSLFTLDAAEADNIREHLEDFITRNQLNLQLFVEVIVANHSGSRWLGGLAPHELLERVTERLMVMPDLYEHLDKRRYMVRDSVKYERKCRELAKALLGGWR